MNDRQTLGRRGEDLAAEHLTRLGWPILARNWRTRGGELDVVARDGEWLVVVEVRARRGRRFGRPEESVDARKQRRLLQLAARYVHSVGWRGGWRIDVVAIDFPSGSGRDLGSAGDSGSGRHSRTQASDVPRRSPQPRSAPPRSASPQSPPPHPGSPLDPHQDKAPHEHVFPDGTRLRHLRHAIAP